MKTKIKPLLILPFFVFLLFITSCQDEVIEITEPAESETIVANSELANLMQATATFDGSSDNILDGASCFSIELPVNIIANGLEVVVESEEDFDVIEDIFDEFQDDDDILEIIFPITIILSDFSEIVINNQNELGNFVETCTPEGEEDIDIECIDFVYPFSVSTFNDEFEVIDVVTLENDRQLFGLIQEIKEGLRASINYPIELELSDGTIVQIDNNTELVNIILSEAGNCDEDDDNDFNDDDFTEDQLNELLVNCPWVVIEVIRNGDDVIVEFREYIISFMENGNATLRTINGDIFNGVWETRTTDEGVLIRLEFETITIFNLEWFVNDLNGDVIKLFVDDGNRVLLEQNCDIVFDFQNQNEQIIGYLSECLWRVEELSVRTDNFEDNYIGTPLNFNDKNSFGIVSADQSGIYTVTDDAATGTTIFQVNLNGGVIRPNLELEWNVVSATENLIRLESVATSGELILRRHCPEDDPSISEIEEIVEATSIGANEWIVALYEVGNVDRTDDYLNYTINFLNVTSKRVVVRNPNTEIVRGLGAWFIYLNENNTFFDFSFDNRNPLFFELRESWQVNQVNQDRIELVDLDENNNIERVLVFEKND